MNKEETITGCDNCPFCNDLSQPPYYFCKHPNTSDENHTDLIHTYPEAESWCPLRTSPIIIKLSNGTR
jgi:hypothetical protein